MTVVEGETVGRHMGGQGGGIGDRPFDRVVGPIEPGEQPLAFGGQTLPLAGRLPVLSRRDLQRGHLGEHLAGRATGYGTWRGSV